MLLKYIVEREARKYGGEVDISVAKAQARELWDTYGERILKKALHHKACTSLEKLRWLCKEYKHMDNPK